VKRVFVVKTVQRETWIRGNGLAVHFMARSEARDGPQPFDPARHMRQVAELVARVFADELDTRGRGALREMQLVGRLSPLLGDALSLALFNDFISGHVWLEGGQLVGNVTLQAVDQAGVRWRISNVAVLPAYRRQGIAEALMLASLREIAQRGGNWAVLQVRADNEAAQRFYTKLGFEDVARDGIYHLPHRLHICPNPRSSSSRSVRLLASRCWSLQGPLGLRSHNGRSRCGPKIIDWGPVASSAKPSAAGPDCTGWSVGPRGKTAG
jgi:ribosomal protein S18 acetylase RimI-like enzyme